MPVHPRFKRRLPVLIKGVCRHCNDRNTRDLLIFKTSDPSCCFISVHDRHLDIHQNQIVLSGSGSFKPLYGDRSVICHIDGKSCLFKNLHRDLLIQLVILNQEDLPALE